jgi:hypothetical protein
MPEISWPVEVIFAVVPHPILFIMEESVLKVDLVLSLAVAMEQAFLLLVQMADS